MNRRFYFFTIYQLKGIQAGIQCLHAALRYANKYGNDLDYKDYVENHETVIVLNGGTTNDSKNEEGFSIGSLNSIHDELVRNGIKCEPFYEPDLNNAMTSVCFLIDERVYDRVNYPNFPQFVSNELDAEMENSNDLTLDGINKNINSMKVKYIPKEELVNTYSDLYSRWLDLIGGKQNEFLRDLIQDKKLFS